MPEATQVQPIATDQHCVLKARTRITRPRLEEQQAGFLADRLAYLTQQQPRFAELRERLLGLAGHEVVPPRAGESDLEALLERGAVFNPYGARMMKGEPSRCHANTAALHEANPESVQIVTGYGLSDDGLWRQHSWGFWNGVGAGRVVETTVKRILYYGFVLDGEEIDNFCFYNI